jgi:hypothetical protein
MTYKLESTKGVTNQDGKKAGGHSDLRTGEHRDRDKSVRRKKEASESHSHAGGRRERDEDRLSERRRTREGYSRAGECKGQTS